MSSLRLCVIFAFIAVSGLCDLAKAQSTERQDNHLSTSLKKFSPTTPLSPAAEQDDKENGRTALKALLGLANATADGLNYREFIAKLREVEAVVDEALRKMGSGPLRDEIAKSLQCYKDARNYWREKAEKQVSALILSEDEVQALKKQYGSGVESAVSSLPDSPKKQVAIEPLVKAIWEHAASIVLQAERKQQKQSP